MTDPEKLSRITGACSGCGSCEPTLMALLNIASLKEPLV
ncbi:bacterioferritin-associated ferredoxin [Methylotuvimicrobium sp. KM1]